MHLHTFVFIARGTVDVDYRIEVECNSCDVQYRLATGPEAIAIRMALLFAEGGPMLGPNNSIVVPMDYSLPEEYANVNSA